MSAVEDESLPSGLAAEARKGEKALAAQAELSTC